MTLILFPSELYHLKGRGKKTLWFFGGTPTNWKYQALLSVRVTSAQTALSRRAVLLLIVRLTFKLSQNVTNGTKHLALMKETRDTLTERWL